MPIYNSVGGITGLTIENDPSALKLANNLSDLPNLTTARTNLQLSTYFAALSHNHTGTYAPVSHTHAITDVTNLQTTLNDKASSTHTHDVTDVTGWGNVNGASNGYVLGWNGSAIVWVAQSGGGGGGGISEAPSDGNVYGRVNGTWLSLFFNTETAATQSWVYGLGYQTATNVSSYVTGLGYQTASNVSTYVTGLGYIGDAPTDGSQYVRQTIMGTSQWVPNSGFTLSDAPDSQLYLRTSGTWTLFNGITDAPNNGSTYARQNAGWVTITAPITSLSIQPNSGGYSNGQFDTAHYPNEIQMTFAGVAGTFYVPARSTA